MKSPEREALEKKIADMAPLATNLGRAIGMSFASGAFLTITITLLFFFAFTWWVAVPAVLAVGTAFYAVQVGANVFAWTSAKVKSAMLLLDGDVQKALEEERAATQAERFGR